MTHAIGENEILSHLEFLPERLRPTVAWLFKTPGRASSYLLQLTDAQFELLPKYVPSHEQVTALGDLFNRLYPGYDIETGSLAAGTDLNSVISYEVKHVCTHHYN